MVASNSLSLRDGQRISISSFGLKAAAWRSASSICSAVSLFFSAGKFT